jgi:transposase-like protein
MTKKRPRFSPECRERAVRLVLDHGDAHGSRWAAIRSIAEKMGCSAEALRNGVRQTWEIRRVYDANQQVYGVRKVWRQLTREQIAAARCQIERLMRGFGLQGVVRGRRTRTTVPADVA